MQDVATLAKVSLSTVSYALSGTRPVSAATRERIEAAMTELGFQPNAAARSLASRRSNVLALVYPAVERGLGGTVAEFVDSAAQVAREHGYHLVLWPFRTSQAEEILDLVRQGMAAGVLVMDVALDDDRVRMLQESGAPYTMIGRTRELEGRPWVDIDFERTADDAVQYLADLGHRHIAFLNHSEQSAAEGYAPTFRADDGYAVAMTRRGLTPVAVHCGETPNAGRAAAAELLDAEPRLSAVITMNEYATFGVVAELQRRGLSVPDDVSILSIVSSPGVGEMSNPPLTTMHAPGAELGRQGVLRLLSVIADGTPDLPQVLVPCSLEEGGTVSRARSPRPALD
ncbi:MAG: LacI family DNA-binding transcriptional regulator [Promicromonosporaceae bacterium]|nr:LacI family DNA-binding transcriptional regulator [Promicromonosporaceae bacterium]